MDQVRSAPRASSAKKLDRLTRHPLILFLIGAIVTSALIPYVSTRAAESKQKAAARREKAVQVLNVATDIDAKFGLVQLELQYFYDEVLKDAPPGAVIDKERLEFRTRMHQLYGEFDTVAWSSYFKISHECSILNILPEKSIHELDQLAVKFSENLVKCSGLIGKPWKQFAGAKPADTRDGSISLEQLRGEIDQLRKERATIVYSMAKLFRAADFGEP